MTITEFLEARIADDEAAAHKLALTDRRPVLSIASTVNHPARILAECVVKRSLIEHWGQHEELNGPALLTIMAMVYADHPDYQQEWAQ